MAAFPHRRSRLRGAVLMELIMTMVVGLLLLSVLPTFYFSYIKLWRQETARLGASEQASRVVRTLKTDIRNARAATVSSDGNTLTLTMPLLANDPDFHVMAPVIGLDGTLVDGDTIVYYFQRDPNHTGSTGGSVYRRITRANGTQQGPRLVADSVYPSLNPFSAGTSSPAPVFYYDPDKETVLVTATASEPKPSAGTFAPVTLEPVCTRDGGALVRVAADSHPEGVVQCSKCGAQAIPATELVTYRTNIRVRNAGSAVTGGGGGNPGE